MVSHVSRVNHTLGDWLNYQVGVPIFPFHQNVERSYRDHEIGYNHVEENPENGHGDVPNIWLSFTLYLAQPSLPIGILESVDQAEYQATDHLYDLLHQPG